MKLRVIKHEELITGKKKRVTALELEKREYVDFDIEGISYVNFCRYVLGLWKDGYQSTEVDTEVFMTRRNNLGFVRV